MADIETDIYSYKTILEAIQRFRTSALSEDIFDVPGHTYFKIIFHFDPGDPKVASSGLLSSGFRRFYTEDGKLEDWTEGEFLETALGSNTAFSYFYINGDDYRTELTKDFNYLLANLNSQTPWYFQKIKGLENALQNDFMNPAGNEEFTLKERQSIQIECLPDSTDERIGTLLDMYRNIVWDWQTKRETLPVNLRKFDMTIIRFQTPILGTHTPNYLEIKPSDVYRGLDDDGDLGEDEGEFADIFYVNPSKRIASFKAYEFHGCEIDYNSSKSGQAELDNEGGTVPQYTINIFFDDALEIRYNHLIKNLVLSPTNGPANFVDWSGGTNGDDMTPSEPMSTGPIPAPKHPAQYNPAQGPDFDTGLNRNLDGGMRHSGGLSWLTNPINDVSAKAANWMNDLSNKSKKGVRDWWNEHGGGSGYQDVEIVGFGHQSKGGTYKLKNPRNLADDYSGSTDGDSSEGQNYGQGNYNPFATELGNLYGSRDETDVEATSESGQNQTSERYRTYVPDLGNIYSTSETSSDDFEDIAKKSKTNTLRNS